MNKRGFATTTLNDMEVRTTIPGFLRFDNEGLFKLPDDPSRPIIMIATDSGIAPFRGFWRKRWEQQQEGFAVGTPGWLPEEKHESV